MGKEQFESKVVTKSLKIFGVEQHGEGDPVFILTHRGRLEFAPDHEIFANIDISDLIMNPDRYDLFETLQPANGAFRQASYELRKKN